MPISHANIPAYGKLLGTNLTASYQQVLTSSDDALMLVLYNSCNDTVIISLDGGDTDHFELEDGDRGFVLDLQPSKVRLGVPDIRAKHAGSAPTSGSIRVTVVRTGAR